MTLPAVIRIFFAIELSTPTKEKLSKYIGMLKKKSKSQAIRWNKPDNLHITLQFLPEFQAIHLERLSQIVRMTTQNALAHATLHLGGIHLFPNPYRPRVIVIDIKPQEELANLASVIGEGIRSLNYEIETRPFRAHLTLGRIKQPQGINLNFLNETVIPAIDDIEVNEVVLFRSEPQADGSIFTPLDRMPLKKERKMTASNPK